MGKKEFVCRRCGKCCVHAIPQFEEDEYIRVRNIALQKGITFIRRDHEDGPIYFTSKTFGRMLACLQGRGKSINGEPVFLCEFLEYDSDGKANCSIYDLRPQVCRVFGLDSKDITKRCLNLGLIKVSENLSDIFLWKIIDILYKIIIVPIENKS